MIKQEEGTEWRRRGVCASDTHTLVSEPKALATASAAGRSREKDETKGNDKSESKKACPGLCRLEVGAIIECAFDDEENGIQWLSSTGLLIFLHCLQTLSYSSVRLTTAHRTCYW